MRRGLLTALALAAAIPAAGCDDDDGGPFDARALRLRLEVERAAWEEVEPASYAYELRRACFCDPASAALARVEVAAGVVVEATYLETVHVNPPLPAGTPVPSEALSYYVPVEALFDLIEGALDSGARSVEVEFHPALHYPTTISITHCAPACADDGLFVQATALAPRFGG